MSVWRISRQPFLSDIRQAVRTVSTAPYSENHEYLPCAGNLVERVFDTLAYFDGIAFARRARAPAWFATGLLDDLVPPVAVFARFHEYGDRKQIRVWEHNGTRRAAPTIWRSHWPRSHLSSSK